MKLKEWKIYLEYLLLLLIGTLKEYFDIKHNLKSLIQEQKFLERLPIRISIVIVMLVFMVSGVDFIYAIFLLILLFIELRYERDFLAGKFFEYKNKKIGKIAQRKLSKFKYIKGG